MVLKVLKVLAKKPQCKSVSEAGMPPLTHPAGCCQVTPLLEPDASVLRSHRAYAAAPAVWAHMSTGTWGDGLCLEIHMQGLSEGPPGKEVTRRAAGHLSEEKDRLRPGARLPPEVRRGATIQQCDSAWSSQRQKWEPSEPHVGRP